MVIILLVIYDNFIIMIVFFGVISFWYCRWSDIVRSLLIVMVVIDRIDVVINLYKESWDIVIIEG